MSWPNSVIKEQAVKPSLDVVCGVLMNNKDEYLVALRQAHQDQAGLWEFPGGKRQAGETEIMALARELNEEIGIKVLSAQPLYQFSHEYPSRYVNLSVWQVVQYQGNPIGAEGQCIQWVSRELLTQLQTPAANQVVINRLFA